MVYKEKYTIEDVRLRREQLILECAKQEKMMREQVKSLFVSQGGQMKKTQSLANNFAKGFYLFDGFMVFFKLYKLVKGKPLSSKPKKKFIFF